MGTTCQSGANRQAPQPQSKEEEKKDDGEVSDGQAAFEEGLRSAEHMNSTTNEAEELRNELRGEEELKLTPNIITGDLLDDPKASSFLDPSGGATFSGAGFNTPRATGEKVIDTDEKTDSSEAKDKKKTESGVKIKKRKTTQNADKANKMCRDANTPRRDPPPLRPSKINAGPKTKDQDREEKARRRDQASKRVQDLLKKRLIQKEISWAKARETGNMAGGSSNNTNKSESGTGAAEEDEQMDCDKAEDEKGEPEKGNRTKARRRRRKKWRGWR